MSQLLLDLLLTGIISLKQAMKLYVVEKST